MPRPPRLGQRKGPVPQNPALAVEAHEHAVDPSHFRRLALGAGAGRCEHECASPVAGRLDGKLGQPIRQLAVGDDLASGVELHPIEDAVLARDGADPSRLGKGSDHFANVGGPLRVAISRQSVQRRQRCPGPLYGWVRRPAGIAGVSGKPCQQEATARPQPDPVGRRAFAVVGQDGAGRAVGIARHEKNGAGTHARRPTVTQDQVPCAAASRKQCHPTGSMQRKKPPGSRGGAPTHLRWHCQRLGITVWPLLARRGETCISKPPAGPPPR